MKHRLKHILAFVILGLAGSCTKPANDNPAYPIPQEVMDYFVNYDPGTCWVYQDTMQASAYDTIELVSKKPWCITPDGEAPNNDGYAIYFKPAHAKDFTMYVNPGKNNTCGVNIYTGQSMGNHDGEMEAVYENNQWNYGTYKDSFAVGNKQYHNVLIMGGICQQLAGFVFAKNIGLVSYSSNTAAGNTLGIYTFVKTFKK